LPAEDRSRPVSYSWTVTAQSDPEAFDRYRDSMRDIYAVDGVDADGRAGFISQTTGSLFDNGSVARGFSGPQILRRTAGRVRSSGLDAISIFVLFAPLVGDADGADVRSTAGSIHFRDLARPSVSQVETIDLVSLMIPRMAAPLWMRDGGVHGLAIGPENPLGGLLATHLRLLADTASGLRHDQGAAAIEAALLITERAVGRHTLASPEQSSAIHATVRHRATRYMQQRLLDPRLTVQEIAQAAGVSRTTLFRAFAPGGLRRYMLDLRLDRARSALSGRDPRRQTVAEVAYRHGFASAAHFARLYRERFGHAPGEMATRRLETRAIADAPRATFRHQLVVNWLRGRPPAGPRPTAAPRALRSA
jgi:AraC-like DNA-binding protein